MIFLIAKIILIIVILTVLAIAGVVAFVVAREVWRIRRRKR